MILFWGLKKFPLRREIPALKDHLRDLLASGVAAGFVLLPRLAPPETLRHVLAGFAHVSEQALRVAHESGGA